MTASAGGLSAQNAARFERNGPPRRLRSVARSSPVPVWSNCRKRAIGRFPAMPSRHQFAARGAVAKLRY